MAHYHYKALAVEGGLFEGEMVADSREAVLRWLSERGHTPIAAQRQASLGLPGKGLRRSRYLPVFIRDLAVLLKAGTPLEQALGKLASFTTDAAETEVARSLQAALRSGDALSVAMAHQPQVFPPFTLSLVHAGEAGGDLAGVLERLARLLKRQEALRASLQGALLYPALLAGLTLVALIVLMTFVVPQFTRLFEQMGAELPWVSRMVFRLGEATVDYGWLPLSLGLFLFLGVRRQLRESPARLRWHALQLRLPGIGKILLKFHVGQFARSLGHLLGNGVPLLQALRVARESLGNQHLSAAVAAASEQVAAGSPLSEALLRLSPFPLLALHMMKVGEDGGRLPEMLLQLGEAYEDEVLVDAQRMLTLLEPLLIVGLGLLVGAIVSALMLAVLSINDLAF